MATERLRLDEPNIRPLRDSDSLEALTGLLHRA